MGSLEWAVWNGQFRGQLAVWNGQFGIGSLE